MVFGFIFELLFELVFEVLFEFLFQVIGDVVFRPLWRRFGSKRLERFFVGAAVGLTAFGYGYGWGAWRVHDGSTTLPQSVWVTLAMAVAFGLAAVAAPHLPGWGPRQPGPIDLRAGRIDPASGAAAPPTSPRVAVLLPWRWTPSRLAHFAAVNVAIAAGIAVGYLTWG